MCASMEYPSSPAYVSKSGTQEWYKCSDGYHRYDHSRKAWFTHADEDQAVLEALLKQQCVATYPEAPLMRRLASVADEQGVAVEYGWRAIAEVGDEKLWGTVTVDEGDVLAFLHTSAKRHLAPGTRYEIRRRVPGQYGRSFGLAWFHDPKWPKDGPWGTKPAGYEPEMGYFLVGEFVVPEQEATNAA